MLTIPNELRDAIEHALAAVPAARWLREAQALSERYRAPRTSYDQPLASGAPQALGYAALILPAAYAQLYGALAATAARIPDWAPETLLDLGSGPGTALWAAVEQWPSLTTLAAWEREPAFITLGRTLAQQSSSDALRTTRWVRQDLQNSLGAGEAIQRYDLVILGHVLNELDPAIQQRVITAAWERTAGVLVLVEPGTSAAFPLVRAARDQLLAVGAQTIAPCPHNLPCPLVDDWCHFPQRLKRPDFQRRARGALSEWEDSKFSFAAMARFEIAKPFWGRVIREPESNKAYAEAMISTTSGIIRQRALKRHRDSFRRIKDLEWGQALEQPLDE